MPKKMESKPRFMQERSQDILAARENQKNVNRLRGEREFRNIILRRQQEETSQLLKSLISPRVFDGVFPAQQQHEDAVDDDKLFVVTSVDTANPVPGRLRQTTVYPEASYHINRLSFSRAGRRPKVNTWHQPPNHVFKLNPVQPSQGNLTTRSRVTGPASSIVSQEIDYIRIEEELESVTQPSAAADRGDPGGMVARTRGSDRQHSPGTNSNPASALPPRIPSKPSSRQFHLDLSEVKRTESLPSATRSTAQSDRTHGSRSTPREGSARFGVMSKHGKSDASTPGSRRRTGTVGVVPVRTTTHRAELDDGDETDDDTLNQGLQGQRDRPPDVERPIHGGSHTFRREIWQNRRVPAGIWGSGAGLARLVKPFKYPDNAEVYESVKGHQLQRQFRRERGLVPTPRHGPLSADTKGEELRKDELVSDWIRICDTVPVSMSKVYSELYSTRQANQVGLQNIGPYKGGDRRWTQIVSDRGSYLQSMADKDHAWAPRIDQEERQYVSFATPELPEIHVIQLVQQPHELPLST